MSHETPSLQSTGPPASRKSRPGTQNPKRKQTPSSEILPAWTPVDTGWYRPAMDYKGLIRSIPDFPNPGVLFRDITPVLADPIAFKEVVDAMAEPYEDSRIEAVVAVEARGYLFGAPIAYTLGAAFVPVRKLGRLPWQTIQSRYELEYGIETVEMHADGVKRGQRVLIVDDVIATGGTLRATIELVERAGGDVTAISVFIELTELGGRQRLEGHDIRSLVAY